jgi:hypothetical protein
MLVQSNRKEIEPHDCENPGPKFLVVRVRIQRSIAPMSVRRKDRVEATGVLLKIGNVEWSVTNRFT